MARRGQALALLALFGLGIFGAAHAKIHHSVVDTDDRKLIPLAEAFGFDDGGKIVITISNIAIYMKHDEEKVRSTCARSRVAHAGPWHWDWALPASPGRAAWPWGWGTAGLQAAARLELSGTPATRGRTT